MREEDFTGGSDPTWSPETTDAETFSVRPRVSEESMGKPPELRTLGNLVDSHDPVPQDLAGAAYAAVRRRWHCPQQQLSLVEDVLRTSSVRSGNGLRILTFRVTERILEVDLRETVPGWYAASGMVITAAGEAVTEGSVLLRHARGDSAVTLDEFGVFDGADVPRGPLSVVLRPQHEAPAVADWMVC